jgi:hypothetical protein
MNAGNKMNTVKKNLIEKIIKQVEIKVLLLNKTLLLKYFYSADKFCCYDGILNIAETQKTVKAQKSLHITMLPKLIALHKKHQFILFSEYIDGEIANILIKNSIEFADLAGNLFLQLPGHTYLLINHEKPKALAMSKCIGRAFSPIGLKLLYNLLSNPELLTNNYRQLQQQSGVSLGSIGWIMNDLKERDFLIELNGQRHFTDKEKLIERWSQGFNEKLRPKLKVERYSSDRNLVDCINYLDDIPAAWGGEIAAYIMLGSAQPVTAQIYQWGNINKLKAKLRLKPDPAGSIELLDAFWINTGVDMSIVSLPLIYADLIAEGGSRNIETATELLLKK